MIRFALTLAVALWAVSATAQTAPSAEAQGPLVGAQAPLAGAQASAAHAGAASVLGPRARLHKTGAYKTGAVHIGIAAFNDFHGALLPPHQAVLVPNGTGKPTPDGDTAIPAGGVAWLASALDAVRARYPDNVTVSAGDLISGSPITSSLFLDEPSVGAMNRMGLEFNALGNHEFDRGRAEILRMAHGGCEQNTSRKPCALEPYTKPSFAFLAANTLTEDGSPLLPPTGTKFFGSGKRRVGIGFIGITLRGTGDISPPEGVKGLRWADEAETANHYAPLLRKQGVDVVAVLIHQGGRVRNDPADPNGCDRLYGDIGEILDRLDPSIDLVISGHTHWAYVCDYVGKKPNPDGTPHHFLLTSAGLWGENVTDIDVTIDPVRHRMIAAKAHNVVVQSDPYKDVKGSDTLPRFTPRADIAAYVQRYVEATNQYSLRKVGFLSQGAAKTEGEASATGGPLGHLIADAQLAATRQAGAQISFMNPFGVRASLTPADDHSLTFGQIYAVQPFGNQLVTITMTGAQIKAMLEQGFDAQGAQQALSPSAGFAYAYDRSHPIGERITAITLDGKPIDPATSYRVTVSDFLANGGDTFTTFTQGTNRTAGPVDLAALEAWLAPEGAGAAPRALPQDARDVDLRPDLNPNHNTPPPGMHY